MMRRFVGVLAVGLLAALGTSGWVVVNGQAPLQENGTITGVVTSEKGPEAGVWVIAETTDLPTKYRKIVVTGDGGRFLLPQLPNRASYKVWVRGYGLVDSAKVDAKSGANLNLTANVAKTPQEAAKVYPSNYWFAMMQIPAASDFPGKGIDANGNGIPTSYKSREQYVFDMNGCIRCHQIGHEWTRIIPPGTEKDYTSTVDSWDKRVRMGQRASEMNNLMTSMGRQRALRMFADWTDRIAKGEVPAAPPRPQGLERNVVLTEWEWGTTMTKIHDIAVTDKRNPRVAPNSPVYGTDIARDYLSVLDPVTASTREMLIPTLEDRKTMTPNYAQSGYIARLGTLDRFNPTNIHNPMKDADGRVWYTANLRPANLQPAWCKEGSTNKFAAYFPLARSGRNVSFYDPKSDKFTMIDTCFGTHHLQFGFDTNNTLFLSSPGGPVYGWINTRQFLATGDGQATQGWCPTVVDTNGDGRITKPWNEPAVRRGGDEGEGDGPSYENFDPKKDTRVEVGAYGIIANKIDGSIWGAQEVHPGKILRFTVGNNPPETCIAEVFELPSEFWGATTDGQQRGSKPRGIDIDKKGIVWTAASASGNMWSFDRSKCKAGSLSGPEAHTGRVCLEGWTAYPLPAPAFQGTNLKIDYYYYNYVDQFNTLGLGEDIPIATGTGSDSLIAVIPSTKQTVFMRVPYPMAAFHPRGMDGRIDDPNAGWKGKGIYSASAQDTVWQSEDGIRLVDGKWVNEQRPIIVKFQVRPNPTAN
jgi:hypothetical protein